MRSLPDETVEFPVSYAAEKSMPLVRREPEDQPLRVPAVTDADLTTRQSCHLDAIAVGVTQRALNPVKTRTRPFMRTPERNAFHVNLTGRCLFPGCATGGDGEPDGIPVHSPPVWPPAAARSPSGGRSGWNASMKYVTFPASVRKEPHPVDRAATSTSPCAVSVTAGSSTAIGREPDVSYTSMRR